MNFTKLIILILTLLLGAGALGEYKALNRITINGQLKEADRDINNMILQYPVMDTLWATVDDEEICANIQEKKICQKMIANAKVDVSANFVLAKDLSNNNDTKNNNDTEQKRENNFDWQHVEELEKLLWGDKLHFNDQRAFNLRQVYMLAESILYLLAEAIELKNQGILTEDDLKTYEAYFNDIGDHPLFLHAVWFGHRSGYFKKEVAIVLREKLIDRPLTEVIYKEIRDRDWPRATGDTRLIAKIRDKAKAKTVEIGFNAKIGGLDVPPIQEK